MKPQILEGCVPNCECLVSVCLLRYIDNLSVSGGVIVINAFSTSVTAIFWSPVHVIPVPPPIHRK